MTGALSGITIEPTTLDPVFSPDVTSYTAWYWYNDIEDDPTVTVTVTPSDGVTVEIIGQKFTIADGYTDVATLTNGGTFSVNDVTRLLINCTKDGKTAQYIVKVWEQDEEITIRD